MREAAGRQAGLHPAHKSAADGGVRPAPRMCNFHSRGAGPRENFTRLYDPECGAEMAGKKTVNTGGTERSCGDPKVDLISENMLEYWVRQEGFPFLLQRPLSDLRLWGMGGAANGTCC